MIYFQSDYLEGAHPRILEELSKTNLVQTVGYGEDEYCQAAAKRIQEECASPSAAVHFLVGGTQTNATVISAALRPFQGVLCAKTAHIACHETGAVESRGHKCLLLPTKDGKIFAKDISEAVKNHFADEAHEHIVQPKMVYLSFPTELGTLYSKSELTAISSACKENGLYLFLDGARLGYGLASPENDLSMADIAELCDAFTIGGTKVGALFGEAVVLTNDELKQDFRYMIKNMGGMLAKGRLLGVQFLTLFEDGLYYEISSHAIALSEELRSCFSSLHISYLVENRTNQMFPILPDRVLQELKKDFGYSYQERVDETHSAVRFCTSWATTEEQVSSLKEKLSELLLQ